jgi:hypothetical protein
MPLYRSWRAPQRPVNVQPFKLRFRFVYRYGVEVNVYVNVLE